MSWLKNRHPEFKAKKERWEYAWKHYTGEYADDNSFLHKKEQAETKEAYEERTKVSDPQLLFPTSVDSLNGILFAKSDKTIRDWGAFGPVDEEGEIVKGSTADKLIHNADGKGTNWQPLMKRVAIKQTVLHKVWGLVDGIPENGGEASVKIIDPSSVVNWWPSTGLPTSVLVKEKQDVRSGIQDEADPQDVYILYELDGWTRFVETEEGERVIGEGEYAFYSDSSKRERILPIFPIEIPMPRDIGYLLAQKQNHIYNFKSIRDFSVRNMSFAFLQLVADQKQYDEIIAEVKKGFRVLRKDPDANGDHEYKSPNSDYLTEAGNILLKDKEDFMESAFRSYGDAAKQVTATEIRQESRSGVEAFLTLLVSSLDEFENRCLFLLEQIYFPETPSNWGQAYVKRSDDFAPEDVNAALELKANVIQRADRAMSLKRKVQLLNPGMTDTEVEEEIEMINTEQGFSPIPSSQIGG